MNGELIIAQRGDHGIQDANMCTQVFRDVGAKAQRERWTIAGVFVHHPQSLTVAFQLDGTGVVPFSPLRPTWSCCSSFATCTPLVVPGTVRLRALSPKQGERCPHGRAGAEQWKLCQVIVI